MEGESVDKDIAKLWSENREIRTVIFGVNGTPGIATEVVAMKGRITDLSRDYEELNTTVKNHLADHEEEGSEMATIKAEKIKLTGVYIAVIVGALAQIAIALISALL